MKAIILVPKAPWGTEHEDQVLVLSPPEALGREWK